uniref:Putative 2-oxoglutarate-dependent dioxygenase At3g49630 isoform X1 n=1 Tax=Rhizophora mucronata TaxID=61149 RepID=A0A2P2L234_RHIMU
MAIRCGAKAAFEKLKFDVGGINSNRRVYPRTVGSNKSHI